MSPNTGRAYYLVDIRLPDKDQEVTAQTFTFSLKRKKLRLTRRREGRYLLRSNLVAYHAYCLQVTLKQRLKALAPGLTPRAVLEKFATLQMVDVHLPTTDGCYLVLPRYTQPDKDQQIWSPVRTRAEG